MYNSSKLFFLPLLLLFSACANIKPPVGGPEDLAPPVVKKTIPENNSTNYKGNTVQLEFDEYVDGQKLSENLIISPLYDGKYEIITKKKTVTIRFREPFRENTTYNINFSESIKDVTKGNFVKNLNLAFSTGPLIDSLSISGQAYDFIQGKGVKDISILIHKAGDTTNVRKHKPLYFTRTNLNGDFTINNVKEGTYNLYALNDANKNFMYDEKENIAYINNLVVNKRLYNQKLGLTKTDKKGATVVGMKQEYEYYLLTLSEGIEGYKLRSDTTKVISDYYEDGKVIRVFNTFTSKDSITLYTEFTDSSGNVSDDTLRILFEEFKDKNKKNPFSYSLQPKNLELEKNQEIKIRFNKPVKLINYPQIKLKKDSIPVEITATDFVLDSTKLNISFINKHTFKDSLVLLFEKGAFINIQNDSSSYFKFKFKNINEENYAILSGTITCFEPNYIFQLVDSKGKVVDSKKNAKEFNYKRLEPGDYQLKVIVDTNKNGRWDATDLDNNFPPERIINYKEKITLRANWEILDIRFDAK